MVLSNPRLTRLIPNDTLATGWIKHLDELKQLEPWQRMRLPRDLAGH
jgi:hypothetical protein